MSTPYHSAYYAHELTKRSASDDVRKLGRSLFNATVDLNPHQLDAALFAFQSPLSRGAILADEVGLGKTIEAGLIISQLWAEHKKRILVIAPTILCKQWAQELHDKFFLESIVLDSKVHAGMMKNGRRPFEPRDQVVICSYHFVMARAAGRILPTAHVVFDYTNSYPRVGKIALVENLLGQSGWLSLSLLTVESLDAEDRLIFAVTNEAGDKLHSDVGAKLLQVAGRVEPQADALTAPPRVAEISELLKHEAIGEIGERNNKYFDQELEKLDRWADDLKHGLESELKDIDYQIKQAQRDSKTAGALAEKVALLKHVKELESERSKKRRDLFDAQDEIDGRKEGLSQMLRLCSNRR